MATVCHIITEGTEGGDDDPTMVLKPLFRSLSHNHPIRPFASQFLSSNSNEMRSILSTPKVRLQMPSSRGIACLTSASNIDPRRVVTEHEQEKRRVYQKRLDEVATNRDMSVETWRST